MDHQVLVHTYDTESSDKKQMCALRFPIAVWLQSSFVINSKKMSVPLLYFMFLVFIFIHKEEDEL